MGNESKGLYEFGRGNASQTFKTGHKLCCAKRSPTSFGQPQIPKVLRRFQEFQGRNDRVGQTGMILKQMPRSAASFEGLICLLPRANNMKRT